MDHQSGQGDRVCGEGWETEMGEHQEVTDGSCMKETCATNSAMQEEWRNDKLTRGGESDVA